MLEAADTPTDVELPPKPPPLCLHWNGRQLVRYPTETETLDGELLLAAQAAWTAADKSEEREAMRRLRHNAQKKRMRLNSTTDSTRRVRQRRGSESQQEQDRGASQRMRAATAFCTELSQGPGQSRNGARKTSDRCGARSTCSVRDLASATPIWLWHCINALILFRALLFPGSCCENECVPHFDLAHAFAVTQMVTLRDAVRIVRT